MPLSAKPLKHLRAQEMATAFQSGALSPVEATAACLKQILKYNPALNALAHLDEKAALHQAATSAKRWKEGRPKSAIDGVPVTIKDWFHVKGWPTRQGSLTTSDRAQANDSLCVTALRDAGAVIIGKTTLPEFGHKGVTHSPLSGITRNPWNPKRTCGGSSGGAAVAAATGMAPLNLGSDAGGSVRIPASFCGVVGIKPSPGLMPAWPPSIFSTLSSIGPLTRNVGDAAMMINVLAQTAQSSSLDFHALPASVAQDALREPTLPKTNAGLRVAVIDAINGIGLSADAQKAWNAQKKHFTALGKVENITLDVPNLAECFNGHWTAAASLMASGMNAKERKKLDARFLYWVDRGDAQHLHDYLRAEYDRMVIGGQFKDLLTSYDVLITPTTPFTAFDVGIDMPLRADKKPFTDWNIFNAFANLARLPAASLPLGISDDGLPVGVQLCAGYLRDGLLIAAARRLEAAIGFTPWLERQEA